MLNQISNKITRRVSRVILMSKDLTYVCVLYMKKEREGKRDAYYGRRPTPPISDVKAQRRSGWALSYLGFFTFRSQQDTNEKENTEMEMRKKMPGNKKNNQQVRLSAHRKSTHFSP